MRVRRHYSLVAHGPDTVEIRHGVWNPTSFTLHDESGSGRLFRIVHRLKDGLAADAIARAEAAPLAEVEAVVDQLLDVGVLEAEPSSALDYYLGYAAPTLAPAADQRPKYRTIRILGDAELADEVRAALDVRSIGQDLSVETDTAGVWAKVLEDCEGWSTNGLRFAECVAAAEALKDAVVVFALKTIQPHHFQLLNRIAMAHRIPWIHAAMDGPFLYAGPTFLPFRTACYECFETRVLMNLREGASYQSYKQAIAERRVIAGEIPAEPLLARLLASHVALEALNLALTGTTFTLGKALSIYLPTMEFSFNEVLRVPGCPACGGSQERDATELYFDMRTAIAR